MKAIRAVTALLCAALVLAACGEDAAAPEPTDPSQPDGDAEVDDGGDEDGDDEDGDDEVNGDGGAEPTDDADDPLDDADGDEPDADPDPEPDADDDSDAAAGSDDGSDGAEDAATEGPEVLAWFARDTGDRLVLEPVSVSLPEPTEAVAAGAVEAVLAGTPDAGLVTFAPAGTTLLDARVEGTDLLVDVSGDVRENPASGGAGEAAFAQQLALTAAQFDEVEAVRLLVEGEPVSELWGHLAWDDPIRPDPYAIAPVVVTAPNHGAEVPVGDVEVSGHALVFEGTIIATLTAPDGTVTEEVITASGGQPEGMPTVDESGAEVMARSSFSAALSVGTPGEWVIELAETDPSDGEGRPPYVLEIPLTVTE